MMVMVVKRVTMTMKMVMVKTPKMIQRNSKRDKMTSKSIKILVNLINIKVIMVPKLILKLIEKSTLNL